MNDTKHPIQSLGIMGPAISIIVLLANQWHPGLGLTDAEAANIINDLMAAIAGVTAIVGRWRATTQISISKQGAAS